MMKAMILAAGFGRRMQALTETTPKPLLKVGKYSLIEHLIFQLKAQGFRDIVINVSYLAEMLTKKLGDGSRYGVNITFSQETQPLEWGGGVFQALPLLGDQPFIVISGDLWTDYPFAELCQHTDTLAHLVLIKNSQHPADFALVDGKVRRDISPTYTYGGMGLFHPSLFKGQKSRKASFCDVVLPAIKRHNVTGECYEGVWFNVGTPGCLANINAMQQNDDETLENND